MVIIVRGYIQSVITSLLSVGEDKRDLLHKGPQPGTETITSTQLDHRLHCLGPKTVGLDTTTYKEPGSTQKLCKFTFFLAFESKMALNQIRTQIKMNACLHPSWKQLHDAVRYFYVRSFCSTKYTYFCWKCLSRGLRWLECWSVTWEAAWHFYKGWTFSAPEAVAWHDHFQTIIQQHPHHNIKYHPVTTGMKPKCPNS